MRNLPPPPVPACLREILKDHPELIERVQERLNRLVQKMGSGTPPLEQAVWALEGVTEGFISEARTKLEAAEASGDSNAIKQAEAMLDLAFSAYSPNMGLKNLDEVDQYFEIHKEAFL